MRHVLFCKTHVRWSFGRRSFLVIWPIASRRVECCSVVRWGRALCRGAPHRIWMPKSRSFGLGWLWCFTWAKKGPSSGGAACMVGRSHRYNGNHKCNGRTVYSFGAILWIFQTFNKRIEVESTGSDVSAQDDPMDPRLIATGRNNFSHSARPPPLNPLRYATRMGRPNLITLNDARSGVDARIGNLYFVAGSN